MRKFNVTLLAVTAIGAVVLFVGASESPAQQTNKAESACIAALDKGTQKALNAYLKRYPDADTACNATASTNAESACTIALDKGTQEAIDAYLKLFPDADTACNATASTATGPDFGKGGAADGSDDPNPRPRSNNPPSDDEETPPPSPPKDPPKPPSNPPSPPGPPDSSEGNQGDEGGLTGD